MSKTNQKDVLDRFYTKSEVATNCVNSIEDILATFDTIVEPSAGGGSFMKALSKFNNIEGYDLEPAYLGITKADWFDINLSGKGSVCVIGNPPFGKRNVLSKAFIMHALSFDNVECIAMILPNSWNKPSLQNSTFPTRWRLIKNEKLPVNSFTFEGKDYKVPCSFQVWIKGGQYLDLRWPLKPKVTHKDFTFVEKEDADFFIMGASPKTLKQPCEVSKK